MNQSSVSNVRIRRFSGGSWSEDPDLVVREEPLEIRLGFGPRESREQESISVTMRTPGHDFELALGFLRTEGVIQHPQDVHTVRYCTDGGRKEEQENIVRVELNEAVPVDLARLQRHVYTSSSCGVCGKTSLEAVYQFCFSIQSAYVQNFQLDAIKLMTVPEAVRNAQTVFTHTGGLHAAALVDSSGTVRLLREDVGRHNAVDKLIGASFAKGDELLDTYALFLSGRAGFELVQKAAMAGIPLVASVGAPSDLAVSLAQTTGITLVGFLREGRFNVYSHPQRIRH